MRKENNKTPRKYYCAKKGSTTIELSFIMPIVIITLVLLIFLSFYLYNQTYLTKAAYICALRGSRMEEKSTAEIYAALDSESEKLLKGRLLAVQTYEKEIKIKKATITVSYKAQQKLPIIGILNRIYKDKSWEIKATGKAKKQNPTKYIRDIRRLAELSEKIKTGGEK